MSRSIRKPILTEGYGSKDKPRRKRAANRAVRKSRDVPPKGSGHKKLFSSWDITDYKFSTNNPKAKRK